MILVRHAESEWNHHFSRTRIDPGIEDPPLTELGRSQAAGLAAQLAAHGVTRLIVSPYRRTLETARIVLEALPLPITIEPLVRERCFFSCDIGSPPDTLAGLWPDLDFGALEHQWWGAPPESEAQLAARCHKFMTKVASLADRPAVAVISHWGFIRALTGEEVTNATLLRYDGGAPTTSGA